MQHFIHYSFLIAEKKKLHRVEGNMQHYRFIGHRQPNIILSYLCDLQLRSICTLCWMSAIQLPSLRISYSCIFISAQCLRITQLHRLSSLTQNTQKSTRGNFQCAYLCFEYAYSYVAATFKMSRGIDQSMSL